MLTIGILAIMNTLIDVYITIKNGTDEHAQNSTREVDKLIIVQLFGLLFKLSARKDKAILSRIGNLRPVRDPTRPAHSTRAAHPLCTLCALQLGGPARRVRACDAAPCDPLACTGHGPSDGTSSRIPNALSCCRDDARAAGCARGRC